ncbi:MAG: VWA domain-containing protein [Bacteroidota bacterium]
MGFSQSQEKIIELNYGVIGKGDDRVKEVIINSSSDQIEQILRIGADENEFDIRLSSKQVSSSKQVILRIKFNPRTKGVKSIDIPLYFSSSDPILIRVKADVNYLEWEDYTPCPDFSEGPKNNDFTVTFKVVNSLNGEAIRNAEVAIAEQGIQQAIWKTNKKGIIEKTVPLGYYAMLARADGFSKSRKEGYINRRNKYFIFALDPIDRPDEVAKDVDEPEIINEETEVFIIEEEENLSFDEQSSEIPAIAEKSSFSLNEYVPNNVVFLIDVSTSMKREQRLEVLKSSMIELLNLLRPQDKLSIITYSSSTDVILNSTYVENKNEIVQLIKDIEGKGLTAGESGIKKAYSIARKNFIEGGNNQVYLATDGAFNKGETDVSKFVKRQSKQGIYMTIVAVKSPKWTIPKMQKIANGANGDYIQMEDFEIDREILNELVKKQSKKFN